MLQRYELAADDVRRVVQAIRDLKMVPLATPFSPGDVQTIDEAIARLDFLHAKKPKPVVDALRLATDQVRRFHERHLPRSWLDWNGGAATGQLVTAIDRVGVHVPGGRAIYPSTLVMTVVPARVAGCAEVVVCSPPGPNGHVPPAPLVAAARDHSGRAVSTPPPRPYPVPSPPLTPPTIVPVYLRLVR